MFHPMRNGISLVTLFLPKEALGWRTAKWEWSEWEHHLTLKRGDFNLYTSCQNNFLLFNSIYPRHSNLFLLPHVRRYTSVNNRALFFHQQKVHWIHESCNRSFTRYVPLLPFYPFVPGSYGSMGFLDLLYSFGVLV